MMMEADLKTTYGLGGISETLYADMINVVSGKQRVLCVCWRVTAW